MDNVIKKNMNLLFMLSAATGNEIASDNFDDAGDKLSNLIQAILPWAIGVLVVLVIIWGVSIGLKFANAKRQEQRVEAKEYLKQFLIGILIIFIVIAIASTVIGALATWAGVEVANIWGR